MTDDIVVENGVRYRSLGFMGFPAYRVGDDGSVWSCLKKTKQPGIAGFVYIQSDEWHKLSPRKSCKNNSVPHWAVQLYPGRKQIGIHRLVLLAFVGEPPEPKMEACHFPDKDPANNCLDNLMWGTSKENSNHMVIHGTRQRGEKIHQARLTADQVRQIRIEYASGIHREVLAEKYGVNEGTIRKCASGETWAHIK